MKIGYKRLLLFIAFLFFILFINTFLYNFLSEYKMIFLIVSLLAFFNSYFIIEKDRHRYLKDVLFEVMLCLVAFFIFYYLLGLIVGLAKNQGYYTFNGFKNFIIPTVLYCVFKEIFRYNMLCKADGNKLCTILVVLLFIIFDITNDYYYSSFDSFYEILKFIALVLLPKISANISFSYISKKMGYKPVVIFELVFELFPYLIPIIPNPNEYVASVIYLLVPVVFAFRILKYFELKKDDLIPRDYHKKKFKGSLLPIVIILSFVYLYSGYFKYYAIAIASGSMEPNINVGDVVIIDQKNREYDIGDIIAYKKDKIIIVHRIVRKIKVSNSFVYYTKGDANKSIDNYPIDEKIVLGKVNLKIPYIGYPTVWLNK